MNRNWYTIGNGKHEVNGDAPTEVKENSSIDDLSEEEFDKLYNQLVEYKK